MLSKTVSFGNIPKTAGFTFSALWFGPKGEKKEKKKKRGGESCSWGREIESKRKGGRLCMH